jgi:hypothetical protein
MYVCLTSSCKKQADKNKNKQEKENFVCHDAKTTTRKKIGQYIQAKCVCVCVNGKFVCFLTYIKQSQYERIQKKNEEKKKKTIK